MTTTRPSRRSTGSVRLVALASFIGTTIEWYDFFLYGTAAALVFNRLFFPNFDPLMGTLVRLRHLCRRILRPALRRHRHRPLRRQDRPQVDARADAGDHGRRHLLIGLLPTYEQIGPWAAVALVLLRVAQGFGVGGEWGGAVLMAVEHAPPGKRGFYGSWPQIGVPAGLVLSTAVFAVFSRLPEEQFLSWGWRVPFLVSVAARRASVC